ncbi:MAG: NBR1-Ig-like domain-containing protein [Anaerolineae bacterium]
MYSKLFILITVFMAGMLIGGCQSSGSASKPTVVITSPLSASEVAVGDQVEVKSTATDTQGVTRVELQVDGATVHTDPSPVAQGQSQFSVVQRWQAAGVGNHTLVVRAYNSTGAYADTGITITVKETAAVAVAGTPTAPVATVTPLPTTAAQTATSAPVSATTPATTVTATATAGCVFRAQYVADVTIPDGAVIQPGATFVKTWRVRNNGTCPWNAASTLVLTAGTDLSTGAATVPALAPGGVADLSVPMKAPAASTSFLASWRLRGADGVFWGDTLTMQITVVSASTPDNSTPTSTPMPGAPVISSFTCKPCTLPAGNSAVLSWGAISNATSVTLDPTFGPVTAPGKQTVSPNATTTYTLAATGPGGVTKSTVTITVVGNFAGHWEDNFGYMDLSQSEANVTGTFHNVALGTSSTIAGTVSGNVLTGTHDAGAGPIQFTLGPRGNTFTGTWNTTNQWCGATTGASFPDGCGFSGRWDTQLGPAPDVSCVVILTQSGSTVTGTYCNGTVSGGVTYLGDYVVLTGTYIYRTGTTGPLVFYLPIYTSLQFQGDFNNTYEWCGWRDGSSAPGVCKK